MFGVYLRVSSLFSPFPLTTDYFPTSSCACLHILAHVLPTSLSHLAWVLAPPSPASLPHLKRTKSHARSHRHFMLLSCNAQHIIPTFSRSYFRPMDTRRDGSKVQAGLHSPTGPPFPPVSTSPYVFSRTFDFASTILSMRASSTRVLTVPSAWCSSSLLSSSLPPFFLCTCTWNK